MKKMMFVMLLIVCGFVCANAQIVVSNNTNTVKLDTNGDGIWDVEVGVQGIPNISHVSAGRNFYSELGRVYVINMWRQYQAQGVNPANYLPNPEKGGDFSAYANVYASRINWNGSGAGMVGAGIVGGVGMVGMPGSASIAVGGKNFGVSLSVPVKSNNNPYYTPNASLGVNVKGNYVGVSVPVSITKKNRTTTTYAPATPTRTTTTAPTTTRRMTTTSTQTSRSTGMTQAEVSAMTNSAYYY